MLTRGSRELVNPMGDSTYLKCSLSVFLGHVHPEEHFSAWGRQRPGVLNLTLISKHGSSHIFKSDVSDEVSDRHSP